LQSISYWRRRHQNFSDSRR